jgi:hypothetical protein
MPIQKSNAYAAVKDSVVQKTGSAKDIRRYVKQQGGYKAGWSVYLSPGRKVGDRIGKGNGNDGTS